MEYLMTYGWAILIIAIIGAALFALGLFNGSSGVPNRCSAKPGFTCANPSYGSNGISVTIGQDSGQNYYNAWVFVASESENIGPEGLPQNFSELSTANMSPIGTLTPGQSVSFNYFGSKYTKAGDIPTANIPVSTPFTGYVWIAYCTSPVCQIPTNFAKVGMISVKEGGGTFSGGVTTTIAISSTTSSTAPSSTTSSTSTSSSTTSVYYVQITLSPSSTIFGAFQQNITFNPSLYSLYESSDLGNVRFYSSITNGVPSGPLDSWLEGCPETACTPSSSHAIFWVKLSNGETTTSPGNTIYMVFGNTIGTGSEFDGLVAGEAPQISSTYAHYDNGPNVFSNYWNFAGPGLPGGWTESSTQNEGSYTVDNGLTLNGVYGGYSTTGIGIIAPIDPTEPYVMESLAESISTTDMWMGLLTSSISSIWGIHMYQSQFYYQINNAAAINVGTAAYSTFYVLSAYVSGSGVFQDNYSTLAQWSGVPTQANPVLWGFIGTSVYQWFRIRTYPPNGVMPTANFGSVQ